MADILGRYILLLFCLPQAPTGPVFAYTPCALVTLSFLPRSKLLLASSCLLLTDLTEQPSPSPAQPHFGCPRHHLWLFWETLPHTAAGALHCLQGGLLSGRGATAMHARLIAIQPIISSGLTSEHCWTASDKRLPFCPVPSHSSSETSAAAVPLFVASIRSVGVVVGVGSVVVVQTTSQFVVRDRELGIDLQQKSGVFLTPV